MMKNELASQMLLEIDSLKKEKQPRLDQMKEIGKYLAPYRSTTTETEDNYSEYDSEIFETRPIDGKKKMRDGLYGYTCSPSSSWFEQDIKEVKDKETISKIKLSDQMIYDYLRMGRFYKEAHKYIDDGVTFGTAAMLVRNRANLPNYKTINPFRFVFDCDEFGNVIFFSYEFFHTASQAASTFRRAGVEIPKTIVDAMKQKTDKPFKFYYCIAERENAAMWDKVRIKTKMPFSEILLMEDEELPVMESGFNESPVALWKFYEASGNNWGFSPADDVFPDVKYCNRISEYLLDGTELRAVPPMNMPIEMRAHDILYAPREIYWTDNAEMQPNFMVPTADIMGAIQILDRKIETINFAYMVDFWTMLARSTKRKTAYEVSAEENERLALIAEPVSSLMASLETILERTKSILIDTGKLNEDYKQFPFKFNGALAQSQRRMAEGGGSMRAMQEIAPFLMGPEQLDVVNLDGLIRRRMEINNADPEIYYTKQETEDIRKKRQEQMEKQQQDAKTLEAAKASGEKPDFSQISEALM